MKRIVLPGLTAILLSAFSIPSHAALILTDVSRSGNLLTISLSGTLDNVGTGDDLAGRSLLILADKRLGDGTPQNPALGYEDLFGGANNAGHSAAGTVKGVTLGTQIVQSGLTTGITFDSYSIRRDGNDASAGDVRGQGSTPGAIDYVVLGLGDDFDVLAAGNSIDLTWSFGLDSTANAELYDTLPEFTAAFALYANDGSNNAQINLNTTNFTEISFVPEPSTFALTSLGLLSLGFVGWRRRRR